MCTVLLLPGDNPIAVNKYIMSYIYFDASLVLYTYINSTNFSPIMIIRGLELL